MCPVGLCKTQNIEGGARQRVVAAGSSQLHQFNKVGQNLVSGCSVQPTVEIPSCTTLRFLSFCAELSVKVGDTRTPGLPVKSGSGKHDYARTRCAFSKIEYTSAGSPAIGNSFGSRQVGHRSDRSQACEALKDWVPAGRWGMGLPFHLCGGILF